MAGGAPQGNQNNRKGRMFRDALDKALRKRSRVDQLEAIEEIADKLVELAMSGEIKAITEIRDTTDGKPAQQVELTGEGGGPLEFRWKGE